MRKHRAEQRISQWSKALRPAPTDHPSPWQHGGEQAAGQRREGIGHGDMARLLWRGKLRRVCVTGKGVAPQGVATENVANPTTGCGVQQTHEVTGGANRRSREERQGRNARAVWKQLVEGRSSDRPGVDASDSCQWKDEFDEPHERSTRRFCGFGQRKVCTARTWKCLQRRDEQTRETSSVATRGPSDQGEPEECSHVSGLW